MSDVHCANILLVFQARAKRYFMAYIKFSGNSRGMFLWTSTVKSYCSWKGCWETAGSHNLLRNIDIEIQYKLYLSPSHFPGWTQKTTLYTVLWTLIMTSHKTLAYTFKVDSKIYNKTSSHWNQIKVWGGAGTRGKQSSKESRFLWNKKVKCSPKPSKTDSYTTGH